MVPKDCTAQMEKINRYAQRELRAEEVYVFPLVLCDNEIDRDLERFPVASLKKLAELYLGKTGVFDHTPTAGNQSARIFDTELIYENGETSLCEPLVRLKAWAYMVRCGKNADLILEIEAGIKKEVSVGCAVKEICCSVCGANHKAETCEHSKGREYGGVVCHHLLCNPTDAYEWSFVAVPAQKGAGVTKGRGEWTKTEIFAQEKDLLHKLHRSGAEVTLTAGELAALRAHMRALQELAGEGESYRSELRQKMVRSVALAQPELDSEVLEQVADAMDSAQLKEFCRVFAQAAEQRLPPRPQTGGAERKQDNQHGVYRV
jgi:hypothetical protein